MARKLSDLWANFKTDEEWFTNRSCIFFFSLTDLKVAFIQNKKPLKSAKEGYYILVYSPKIKTLDAQR